MLANGPLVSIGMPVYNGEPFIRQAIDSLLGQTYKNLEVIISDNASTDATAEISLEYAAKDSRIRYHRNDVNIGVYANFNRVFNLSSGEYFMWAAADDIRPPRAVENCLEALLKDDRAVMAHGTILIKSKGREDLVKTPNELQISGLKARERIHAFTIGIKHNAMLYGLYRRCALASGTLGSCYGQDYLLTLQMSLLGTVKYVRPAMIISRERTPVPCDNPMYVDLPITVTNLLRDSGLRRRKCWTVLLMGCYYLSRMRGISLTERLGAVAAHVATFSRLYKSRLAKEVVFQLFEPLAWLGFSFWHLAQRSQWSLRLARKVQTTLRV
jgi:glycosyltransferase involved in cell wall biosynthesis